MPDLFQKLDASLHDDVVAAALAGLTATRKTLPPALFYDEDGCRLFERITQLPEYYATRTEMTMLPAVAAEVAMTLPGGVAVVEYGASTEAKATILLSALPSPTAWVPVDVAAPSLHRAAGRLRKRLPSINVFPVVADFLDPLALPAAVSGCPLLGFFPGSTIGNLDRVQAQDFLRRAALTLRTGAHFLIGVDLPKDEAILLAAYDDAQGVTAAFNRNLLHRLNREAGAAFDPAAFDHRALWNSAESRIEMHLVSRYEQTVRVADAFIRFAEGETIHTENSHKFTIESFREMARAAGWTAKRAWTDVESLFSIHLLVAG